MRKITPVFGRNRKPAYPCAIPLKSQTDLQPKYANSNRQPLFFASFCNKFPVTGDKALRRLVSEDCVRHQKVRANNPGFPAPTIPRLFSALARKLLVCGVYSARRTGLGRRTRKWVSDAEFWVPDYAAATNILSEPSRQSARLNEIVKGSDCNQGATGALSSPLTKSSSADSVLSSRHNGN